MGESCGAGRAEIGTNAIVEIATTGTEGAVGFAEVETAFV